MVSSLFSSQRACIIGWTIFVLGAVVAAGFAYHYFPSAFPIIDTTISMTREEAIKKAQGLVIAHQLQPHDGSEAARFSTDSYTQYYVELEAGGIDVFRNLLKDPDYTPYTWQVRIFKENSIPEATLMFKADGTTYGFIQHLPKDAPGAALSADDARQLAEKQAPAWNIDLQNYTLIESAQKTNPAGRIDHTFTYEHASKKVGAAPFRIKLRVFGDALSTAKRLIKVPEEFARKYQEMRSANNTLAHAANQLINVLYMIIGIIGGIIFLMRRRMLLWKPALGWAIFMALLSLIEHLNSLPLLWFSYPTSISARLFFINYLIRVITQVAATYGIYFGVFLVAEGLSRAAFGNQPQFWKGWFPPASSSTTLISYMTASYLLVAIWMAYDICLYIFALHHWGWWAPASTLFDPNILATYLPWIKPLVASFEAGFIEECLFRAIPLAGIALIGQRFGGKKWLMGMAFILQAAIFGAAHANYPAQPFYARLVEIFFPALAFGALYIRFGLMFTVLTHFAYDVVWFSLPLWIASSPGIWFFRALVLIGTFLPLIGGVIAKLRHWGKKIHLPLNKEWHPTEHHITTYLPYNSEKVPHASTLPLPLWAAAGILGLALLIAYTPRKADLPPLALNRSQTAVQTPALLTEKGIPSQLPWQSFYLLSSENIDCYTYPDHLSAALQRIFIWREHPSQFHNLLSFYLAPLQWKIRVARFEGNVTERAEQYFVSLPNNPLFGNFCHRLAEEIPGATLAEADARALARNYIEKNIQSLSIHNLVEVAAIPTVRPHRKDWLFVWRDSSINVDPGQARLLVFVAGDKVVETAPFIFVPQEWQRAYSNEQAFLVPIRTLGGFAIALLLLIALACLGLSCTKAPTYKTGLTVTGSLILLWLIDLWNNSPAVIGSFRTAQPYWHQIFTWLGWSIINLIGAAFFIGALYSLIQFVAKKTASWPKNDQLPRIIGFSLAALLMGFSALALYFGPKLNPLYPSDLASAQTLLPWLHTASQTIYRFILTLFAILLATFALNRITDRWHRHKLFGLLIILLAAFSFAATSQLESISGWLIAGTAASIAAYLIYFFILRFDHRVSVPLATGLVLAIITQQALFQIYPGALLSYGVAVAALLLVSCWTSRNLIPQ